MLIRVKPSWEISENNVTPEEVYLNRRNLIKSTGLFAASTLIPGTLFAKEYLNPTSEKLATTYNNFWEFGLDKSDPVKYVNKWTLPDPWTVEITGLVDKPQKLSVEDLVKLVGGTEERIYRFRCVEAWSMIVPWQGFSLARLIEKLGVNSKAKYVVFTTYLDRKQMPGVSKLPYYSWPYTEGLTIEEAKHPLTLLATGMYGKPLPKQNGASIRLVVPWKYGFKSIKSIAKIEFSDKQPKTLWNEAAPDEYGFYANVNPKVHHPRWSQATERVLDGKFFPTKIKTLKFNGYEADVASLYKNLDLNKNF